MEAAAAPRTRTVEPRARSRVLDRETFIRLCEPDFDGMYDLLLRMLRNRQLAGATLRATLDEAWEGFCDDGAPYDVAGWLLVLARAYGLAAPAKRRSNGVEREAFEFTRIDFERIPDSASAFDMELIELVWDEVTTFDLEDYSLLDLHLRHDVGVDALAAHLDLSRDDVAGRLSWLCNSLNDAVAATLLARRARYACAGLDEELEERDDVRRAVRGHVLECDGCLERKREFFPATDMFSSFAPTPTPAGLRTETARAFLAPVRWRRRKLR
jgi:hypothetical protein